MTLFDITVPLSPGIAVWPGDPPFDRRLAAVMGQDSAANVSQVTMSVHSGTHVDAPIHFIAGGAGIETLAIETLIGPCRVCTVAPSGRQITAGDLQALALPDNTRRLLIKTTNSRFWAQPGIFHPDFIAFSEEAARWIVQRGIRLIGIDYLSVEPFDHQEPVVHWTLLAAGVIPLEGINLSAVTPGDYTLACLPLKITGSDGAPARAVLIRE